MQFDRKKDKRDAPKRQTGEEVLNELQSLRPITFGKAGKKQVVGFGKKHNWNIVFFSVAILENAAASLFRCYAY